MPLAYQPWSLLLKNLEGYIREICTVNYLIINRLLTADISRRLNQLELDNMERPRFTDPSALSTLGRVACLLSASDGVSRVQYEIKK